MKRAFAGLRRFMIWGAVCALVLRSLIPAGFMPDFEHGPALVICDGTDHHAHMHHHHGGPGGGDVPCPFACGAIFSFDGVHVVPALLAVFVVAVLALFALPLPLPQHAYVSARPRAPPVFS